MSEMKTCRICLVEKPADDFPLRYRQCKPCRAAKLATDRSAHPEKYRAKKRRWYEANITKAREYTKAWRAKNPERAAASVKEWHLANRERLVTYKASYFLKNREAFRAARKDYYLANKEEAKRNAREWLAANKDRAKERARIYFQNNRERGRVAGNIRRARMHGKFTEQDIRNLLIAQAGMCVACSGDLSNAYHIDHILPIVLGGSSWPDNLQLLCPTCNLKKGAKHPDAWRAEIGLAA